MLKVDAQTLAHMETQRPGIREQILRFDGGLRPACSTCGSPDTAVVHCGVVGQTVYIALATTRFKLIANGPGPGRYFCNACHMFFG